MSEASGPSTINYPSAPRPVRKLCSGLPRRAGGFVNVHPIAIDLFLNLPDSRLITGRLKEMAVASLPLQVFFDRSVPPGHIGMSDDPVHRFFEREDAGLYRQTGIIAGLFRIVEPAGWARRVGDKEFRSAQFLRFEKLVGQVDGKTRRHSSEIRGTMRPPDLEQILLAVLGSGSGLFPYRGGQGARSVWSGTRHLHASIAVGFVVVAEVPEVESAEDRA